MFKKESFRKNVKITMEINGMTRDKKLRYDISKYQLQKYQR